MSITENQAKLLEELEAQWVRGEIPEAEYRIKRARICQDMLNTVQLEIQTGTFLDIEKHKRLPAASPRSSDSDKQIDSVAKIDQLTTCSDRSKTSRKALIERHKGILKNSKHAKKLRPSRIFSALTSPENVFKNTSLQNKLSLKNNASAIKQSKLSSAVSGLFKKNSKIDKSHAKTDEPKAEEKTSFPEETIKERSNPILSIGTTLGIAVGLVVLTAAPQIRNLLSTQGGFPSQLAVITGGSEVTTRQASQETSKYIKPLFGAIAVQSCQSACRNRGGSDLPYCLSGCKKRSLVDYARRITTKSFSASGDHKKIVSLCSKTPKLPLVEYSEDEWKTLRENQITLLKNLSSQGKTLGMDRANSELKNLLSAISFDEPTTKLNKTARASSAKIRRALCLRCNLVLAEIGAHTARRNADSFSLSYYYNLHQRLLKSVQSYEPSLFKKIGK